MAVQLCLCLALFPWIISANDFPSSGREAVPKFAFSWLDDKDLFQAGDFAVIKIKVLDNFDSLDKEVFKPTINVNGRTGNSSYVSGVLSNFGGDIGGWTISFTPITVGSFNVLIKDDRFRVFDSSLLFRVVPGRMHPSVSFASWNGLVNEFVAGTKASILILPKDAFGNNISSLEEPNIHNFTLSAFYVNNTEAMSVNVTYMGWNEFGYVVIDFVVVIAGNFFLHVECDNQTVNGSPLPFKVNPGPLQVSNCIIKWDFEPNAWQLFSKMEIFIHERDQFDNLVPGLYAFDAEIVEKETNLSIPISDLHFEEIEPGIQLFSFRNLEPGNFLLTIYDIQHNSSISSMPYAYNVYVGYCDDSQSVVNGTGLNTSVAGDLMQFSVYLNDKYQYPSPVEVGKIQVLIVRELDSYYIEPSIHPIQIINGSGAIGALMHGGDIRTEISHMPLFDQSNISDADSNNMARTFDVIYTPDKSGFYKIHVLCGNILLNGGHSFTKEVLAGEVNITLSTVVKFATKVSKMTKNEIEVQLMDSFFNPVLSQSSRLKLEIVSTNGRGFSSSIFVGNNNGSYITHYIANDVGTYEICASFDSNRLSPCPFRINVYSGEYFPKALNDTVSVWEDESIAFDALENDYFAGDNATISSFTNPYHGSLIQYGGLLRYTPFKDYYGNDSFVYTISDINGNLATATVNIFVLSIPPQFVSFPAELHATEDVIIPKFGGIPGFEIRYSDDAENISVNLSAQFGSIFLSSMVMQFEQPMINVLWANLMNGESRDLILSGCLDNINYALQSIQYLGNQNFSGNDTIRITSRNMNGVNVLDIPVLVEPINDAPFIHVPEIIILKGGVEQSLVFDRERDQFDISLGDPDISTFPGGESNFMVIFSVEVSEGLLSTSLPSELVNTTELKFKSSYQWQPLQTYVSISRHFTVKAKGIRFRGTGGEHGSILTITLNDMGNYGCYPDCTDKISVPLYAEAIVTLIRSRPMSSLFANVLGSAIAIEFMMVFCLGVVLAYFTYKCAILLVNERINRRSSQHTSQKRAVITNERSNKHIGNSQACTSAMRSPTYSLLLRERNSGIRQRSRREYEDGESSNATASCNHPCSSDDQSQPSPLPGFMPLSIERGKTQKS